MLRNRQWRAISMTAKVLVPPWQQDVSPSDELPSSAVGTRVIWRKKAKKKRKKSEYSVYQIDGAELLTPFKSSIHQYAGWDINQGRNRERIMEKDDQRGVWNVEGKRRKIRIRENKRQDSETVDRNKKSLEWNGSGSIIKEETKRIEKMEKKIRRRDKTKLLFT